MNTNSKSFVLFLVFIWVVYIAWEMDIQSSLDAYPEDMTRYDLWILPYLILYTAYAVYVLTRKES